MDKFLKIACMAVVAMALTACSGGFGSGKFLGSKRTTTSQTTNTGQKVVKPGDQSTTFGDGTGSRLGDLFKSVDDNTNVRVNKYLWNAALETLSFLPIEAADPFTGVMVLGWGKAPGAGTQFRATVLVQDPALEAGSLKVAVQKRGGPASAETNRRIEDAILTRARQLRIRDAKRR